MLLQMGLLLRLGPMLLRMGPLLHLGPVITLVPSTRSFDQNALSVYFFCVNYNKKRLD